MLSGVATVFVSRPTNSAQRKRTLPPFRPTISLVYRNRSHPWRPRTAFGNTSASHQRGQFS
jgi:hypothetical protein